MKEVIDVAVIGNDESLHRSDFRAFSETFLPTPSFFLPATRVNPLRGFIRPALRVTRIKARHDMATHSPPSNSGSQTLKRLGR